MLHTKTTKKGIIDRIINLDKATMLGKKPHIVMISRDKQKGWRIVEHYFNINHSVKNKEYFYDNYKTYLNNADLDKNTPVIVNDLPIVD